MTFGLGWDGGMRVGGEVGREGSDCTVIMA